MDLLDKFIKEASERCNLKMKHYKITKGEKCPFCTYGRSKEKVQKSLEHNYKDVQEFLQRPWN